LGIAPRNKGEKNKNSDKSYSTTWSGIYVVPKDIKDWSQCGAENEEDQFFSLKTLSTTSEHNKTQKMEEYNADKAEENKEIKDI
jgi:hypothetical protein